MCALCVEIIKEKLTTKEFWRNYAEVSEDHRQEVINVLKSKTSAEYQDKLINGALLDE